MSSQTSAATAAARRPMPRVVVALAIALGLVVAGLVAAPASPAAAATAGPSLVAVPGATTISTEWSKVAGSTGYALQVSTSSTFKSHTKTLRTSGTRLYVKGLTVRKTYYVRVRSTSGVKSSSSSVRKVVTTTSAVGYTQAKVTAAGIDKIKVSWPRLKRGTRVVVTASYSNDVLATTGKHWSTSSIPSTRTSTVVTIPSSYRSKVGSVSGNPVYVRVFFYNGSKQSKSPVVFGWASPTSVTGTTADRLTFATWNVGNYGATLSLAGHTWDDRRAAVAAGIVRAAPDVLTVQELSTANVRGVGATAVYQYQDLANLLAPHGYRMALPGVAKAGAGAARESHIFVDAKVGVIAAGLTSQKSVAHTYSPTTPFVTKTGSAETDRQFEWAHLRNVATGADFYVVSIHLPTGSASQTVKVRNAITGGMRSWIEAKAAADGRASAPIVVGGDFNSYVEAYPSGPTTQLASWGYTDSVSTTSRSGTKYGSTNNYADDGYPAKPFRYTYVGPRIDHLFVRHGSGVVKYVNEVVLTSSGTFDERYRGSDHNLQLAVLSLR
ncbi:endonuclease/exonuclease/phosphatase family protein [Cellulomonas alba]|uniref:Endonuclease/exonuclease/phosphatase family protein n=1 Tax=Cellulomonas alba TaxID=3053467 RepID=A0ABT7SCV9_9CELL|nr:endonuclease/exonuclease/phosphatase family protein [Cellulomonas alba]MDM7854020.1 endonuclease/exonuclease/phosphatase family protein [Cellulomonas alba]